jgi:hypothetical protein
MTIFVVEVDRPAAGMLWSSTPADAQNEPASA